MTIMGYDTNKTRSALVQVFSKKHVYYIVAVYFQCHEQFKHCNISTQILKINLGYNLQYVCIQYTY